MSDSLTARSMTDVNARSSGHLLPALDLFSRGPCAIKCICVPSIHFRSIDSWTSIPRVPHPLILISSSGDKKNETTDEILMQPEGEGKMRPRRDLEKNHMGAGEYPKGRVPEGWRSLIDASVSVLFCEVSGAFRNPETSPTENGARLRFKAPASLIFLEISMLCTPAFNLESTRCALKKTLHIVR